MNWYKTAQRIGHRNLAEVKTREVVRAIIDQIKYKGLPKGNELLLQNGVDFNIDGLNGVIVTHENNPNPNIKSVRAMGSYDIYGKIIEIYIYTPPHIINIPEKGLSDVYNQLTFAVSHEIIHVPQKEIDDLPKVPYNTNDPYLAEKMDTRFINPNEIEAYVRSLRHLSRKWKESFGSLLSRYLSNIYDGFIADGVEQAKAKQAIKRIEKEFLDYARQRYPKLSLEKTAQNEYIAPIHEHHKPGHIYDQVYVPSTEDGNKTLGNMYIRKNNAGEWHLGSFEIDERTRGRGIGTKMLQYLIYRAKEEGIRKITLDTECGGKAIKLYTKFGFSVVSKNRDNTCKMELNLDSTKTASKKEKGESKMIEELAKASDAALDEKYSYGRAKKGTFGWECHISSAKRLVKLIEDGERGIEVLADASHEGWSDVAKEYDDSIYKEKPQKKEQRLKLANTPYKDLPEDEKEKDRIAAKAVLEKWEELQ